MDRSDKPGSINLPMIDCVIYIILSRVHKMVVLTALSYQPDTSEGWTWKHTSKQYFKCFYCHVTCFANTFLRNVYIK
jgi:hypothetical protein